MGSFCRILVPVISDGATGSFDRTKLSHHFPRCKPTFTALWDAKEPGFLVKALSLNEFCPALSLWPSRIKGQKKLQESAQRSKYS